MNRYWIKIIFLLLIPTILVGQTVSPSLISSAGTQVKIDEFRFQWSLGEVVSSQVTNQSLQLTLGFHQNLSESSSTSIEEENFELLVYPNPAHTFVVLDANPLGEFEYRLMDALGKIVLQGAVSEKTSINLSTFPSGVYFIEFRRNQIVIVTRKIIRI